MARKFVRKVRNWLHKHPTSVDMAMMGVTIVGIVIGIALAAPTAGIAAGVIAAALAVCGFVLKNAADNWLVSNIEYLNVLRQEDVRKLVSTPSDHKYLVRQAQMADRMLSADGPMAELEVLSAETQILVKSMIANLTFRINWSSTDQVLTALHELGIDGSTAVKTAGIITSTCTPGLYPSQTELDCTIEQYLSVQPDSVEGISTQELIQKEYDRVVREAQKYRAFMNVHEGSINSPVSNDAVVTPRPRLVQR